MPNAKHHFEDAPTAVDRACQIARTLFQHARGHHDTDADTIRSIARHARLTPAAFRRFIQPSRRPKDVSLSVWQRLLGSYRRYLARELAALQDEIDRLEAMDPDDRALRDLLDKARALVLEVEAAAGTLPAGRRDAE